MGEGGGETRLLDLLLLYSFSLKNTLTEINELLFAFGKKVAGFGCHTFNIKKVLDV